MKKQNDLGILLDYAGKYKILTFIGLILSAIAMILGMFPYICVWLVAKNLIDVAPFYSKAKDVAVYGWWAFLFAFGGIIAYFLALMCTHLAAFRTASNIRKRGLEHLLKAPIGFFDSHASGLLRNRLDSAASETETLLAHNLADIVGTLAMFIVMIILMFVFDWRMGAACLLSAVISIVALSSMMSGKNAKVLKEYQVVQDYISKAGTEYVRGIPVVKVFQQTVYSFKTFKKAIEEYSQKAEYFQGDVCRKPQSINLTFCEGAFVFLVPVALFLAPSALAKGHYAHFVTNFAFYAVFSAIISTALARIMFAANGMMIASSAISRLDTIMNAPVLKVADNPKIPTSNKIEFKDVSFTYEGAVAPALTHLSFTAEPGQTVAFVGPSGSGKTTAVNLIPRFFDVDDGRVEIGGIDVREMDPHVLMNRIAFVFQDSHLFKGTIRDNLKIASEKVTDEDIHHAIALARCEDIIEKLPKGLDTVIGEGTYLSGGEQQRIAIARAILKDAPIVVLDEATAFADPENEALIHQGLKALAKDRTVIMIAHRLSTVVGANKIIVLEEGQVKEEGTHEQLVANGGLYSQMWNDYHQSVQWKISKEKVAG